MVFALTERLADEILQALENQEQKFLVDAQNSILVSSENFSADEDSFFSLPEWNSSDGFALMEDFVSTLHSPIAKDELQQILHSGRGVFRNFKDTLKKYPEVEKLWHRFKNRKMRLYINGWYNQLREIWGLEKLDHEPEETGDLIQDDFNFESYSSSNHEEVLFNLKNAASGEIENSASEELKRALFDLWIQQFEEGNLQTQIGIVCHSNSDEFAGCITAKPVYGKTNSRGTDKIVVLTSFYVLEKFRGLGIGSELLELFINTLKDQKKKWVLLTNTIIPDSLMPLLIRNGFERMGSGFVAKL
ncbi:MAG: UPF0158 family protein [Treponema sp.]|jgi:ribosomal protein S18 acetylase RimI-like enzyme|nr:UPF0158 family protein [Treponema sp.]